MSASEPEFLSDHRLWMAIEAGDVDRASQLLRENPSLVHRDFRPAEKQDPHTFGFPLVRAVELGDRDMVELLVEYGADVDAKSPCEEQRELGKPILKALEQQRYDLMHFLLDRGASAHAYGYCAPSLVDLLYEASCKSGAPREVARQGLSGYLGEPRISQTPMSPPPLSASASEETKLFARVLDLGGQPSMDSLVRMEYSAAVDELLRTCPDAAGTQFDYPPGTVFETLCRAASWHGFPQVLQMAKTICPDHYGRDTAVESLQRALVSHNRDGTAAAFLDLVQTELEFLRRKGFLDEVIDNRRLLPHLALAKDYLWPGWCGNASDPSTPDRMIELSKLFVQAGFTDLNAADARTGETALQAARSRLDHPGISQFVDYLLAGGARDS